MQKDLIKEIEKQIVHTNSLFIKDEDFWDERFMKCRIAAMHSGINRNNSRFSKETIEKAKNTFANIPVLADVIEKTDEDGNIYLDYSGHSMHIEADVFHPDQDRIIYDEKVVGIVPETNNFEMILDNETGNYYVYVDALLYRDYGNYVCDILESRDNNTDVSMEISCDDVSFSAKDKCLDIGTMTACAITLLGADVKPGMAKAHATTFGLDNKSKQEQLLKIMQELKESLDNYTKTNQKGGNGKMHFDELLEKYGKTIEDITFEYEGLSDEELDAKFAEVFATENNVGGNTDPEVTPGNTDPSATIVKNSLEPLIRTYEISHEDIRYALYNLLTTFEDSDDEYYYISSVYDTYFTYENWKGDKIFGQAYKKDGDNVSFDGERYNLHRELLTDSEFAELQSMRSNYALIQEKLEKYEAKEQADLKKAEFKSPDYASIVDKPEFVELAKEENHKDFSLDEIKTKLNDIILSYAKAGNLNFAEVTKPKGRSTITVTRLPMNTKNNTKKSGYKKIFSKNN